EMGGASAAADGEKSTETFIQHYVLPPTDLGRTQIATMYLWAAWIGYLVVRAIQTKGHPSAALVVGLVFLAPVVTFIPYLLGRWLKPISRGWGPTGRAVSLAFVY